VALVILFAPNCHFVKVVCSPTNTKLKFLKVGKKATKVLGLTHYLCGLMSIVTFRGAKYFFIFVDDYFQYKIVCFIKYKSKVFEKIQILKAFVKNQTSEKITII